MLTFFRRIRRGLLGEGAVPKYFLYAIGEIALVVIGILIALQINNWNVKQIGIRSAISHCEEIFADLKSDLVELDSVHAHITIAEQRGMYLWQFLLGELKQTDTTFLKHAFVRTAAPNEFSPRTTAYENLIASGAVHFLRSKELIRSLASYYKENPFDNVSIDQRTRYSNEYFDIRYKYTDPIMLRNYFSALLDIGEEETDPVEYIKVDWRKLSVDEEFKLILGKVLSQKPVAKNRIQRLKFQIDELQIILKSEINNS